jgi:hypothetical protein
VALDPVAPRSRRALLLGGLGGVAAAALGSLARPDRAAATDHSALIAGEANSATLLTSITQATAGVEGLKVTSTTGAALHGKATTGAGVVAENAGTAKPALTAQNAAATTLKSAIQGFAGTGALPAPQVETGVEGECNVSLNSVGVYGGSTTGTGVYGNTDNGTGVAGVGYWGLYGTGAIGVQGDVDSGLGVQGWTGAAVPPTVAGKVGVWAGAENGRIALQTQGVSKFNRSGRASIAVGTSSKKIIVPGGITTAAFGIATIQGNRAGYYVQGIVSGTADSSITVYLNKAVVTSAISIGWIVFS